MELIRVPADRASYAQHTPRHQPVLTGSELLAKVKELGQAPRDKIAIACGYTRKDGKAALPQFSEALMQAHGIALPPATSTRKPRAGKPLSWNVAVSKTGIIPVSAGYATLLGLVAGDRVDIEHDAAAGSLVLRKAPPAGSVVVTPDETAAAPEGARAPF